MLRIKNLACFLSIFLLIILLSSFVFSNNNVSANSVKYDTGVHTAFFVHVPMSDNFRDNIYLVGLEDNTNFKIYDITDNTSTLKKEGTIGRGQVSEYKATTKKFYKIIADKSLEGYIIGGTWAGWKDQSDAVLSGSMFNPSTNGSFVGREFIFMAGGSWYNPTPEAVGQGTYASPINAPSVPVRSMAHINIYSIQSSHIQIFNMTSGELLSEFDMGPDMYRAFQTTEWAMYRIVSTGDLVVQNPGGGSCAKYAPSTDGGFVGKVHYGTTQAYQRGCFLVIAYEPCDVDIFDVDTGEKIFHHSFESVGMWGFGGNISAYWTPFGRQNTNNLGTRNLKFVSTGNTAVLVGDTQDSITGGVIPFSPIFIGDDVSYVGGIDDKEFYVYAASYLVIFAAKDARVEVNSTIYNIKKDGYLWIKQGGFFHILSDATIIVEAVFLGSGWGLSYSSAGIQDYATALVSASDISSTAPGESGAGNTLMSNLPIIVVAVAVGISAFIFIIYRSRRR